MSTHALSELIDFIDNNIQWRKREITTTKIITSKLKSHELDVFIRSSVCLVYAHWEGFVKECSDEYIKYVQNTGYIIGNLSENFRTISLMGVTTNLQSTKKYYRNRELLTEIEKLDTQKVKATDFHVETMSNLNTEVFKDIAFCLGIDSTFYELKSGIIDQKILGLRNPIAHGSKKQVSLADFLVIHDTVLELINRFRDDLQNAAVTERYRIKS